MVEVEMCIITSVSYGYVIAGYASPTESDVIAHFYGLLLIRTQCCSVLIESLSNSGETLLKEEDRHTEQEGERTREEQISAVL